MLAPLGFKLTNPVSIYYEYFPKLIIWFLNILWFHLADEENELTQLEQEHQMWVMHYQSVVLKTCFLYFVMFSLLYQISKNVL